MSTRANLTLLRLDEAVDASISEEERDWRSSRLGELFALARQGAIPRYRPLKSWEAERLNERHYHVIMLRAGGMKQTDIAELCGYRERQVSIILNHPDAEYILDQMASIQGTAVLSIEQRLQALSPKAVDAIEGLFDAGDKDEIAVAFPKARMGFAVLERNGFGRKRQVEVDHKHTHNLAPLAAGADAIARALHESRQLGAEEIDYIEIEPGMAPGRLSGPSSECSPPDNDQEPA